MLTTQKLYPRKGILNHLKKLQESIDCLPSYEDRVRLSKTKWLQKKKSKAHKVAFEGVEKVLKKMAIGDLQFCNYCEANIGSSIEHIFPRGLFPDKTFQWDNFLWACNQCNGVHKHAQFQVFENPESANTIDLKKDYKFVEPPNSDAVLINLRQENPLDFLELNLDTGLYEIRSKNTDSRAYKKAAYTLLTLKLNDRKGLLHDRKATIARLTELLSKAQLKTQELSNFIESMRHRSIVAEIIRQQEHPIFHKAGPHIELLNSTIY